MTGNIDTKLREEACLKHCIVIRTTARRQIVNVIQGISKINSDPTADEPIFQTSEDVAEVATLVPQKRAQQTNIEQTADVHVLHIIPGSVGVVSGVPHGWTTEGMCEPSVSAPLFTIN